MASAATARAMVPASESWQWPRRFRQNNTFKARHKLPNECDFDYEVRRLKLTDAPFNRIVASMSLRYWAMANARIRYVPTELLDAWGIVVDFEKELRNW